MSQMIQRWKLVDAEGTEFGVGDTVKDAHDDLFMLTHLYPPHHAQDQGRIIVKKLDPLFVPSVFGLEFVVSEELV